MENENSQNWRKTVKIIKIHEKTTLTVKSWIDLLSDWPAIVRFNSKVDATGLENSTLIDGENREIRDRGKRVCKESAEKCFCRRWEADEAATVSFRRKRKRVELQMQGIWRFKAENGPLFIAVECDDLWAHTWRRLGWHVGGFVCAHVEV